MVDTVPHPKPRTWLGNLLASGLSGMTDMAKIMTTLLAGAPKPKTIKPKLVMVGQSTQEHFFVGRGMPSDLPGPARKHLRKSREFLVPWNVQIKEVPIRHVERIDRNKYQGERLQRARKKGLTDEHRVAAKRWWALNTRAGGIALDRLMGDPDKASPLGLELHHVE